MDRLYKEQKVLKQKGFRIKESKDIVYSCHICSGTGVVHLAILDKIQRHICNLIDLDQTTQLRSPSHHPHVASICFFYKYFQSTCFDEPSCLVPRLHKCNRDTRSAIRSHCLTVELARKHICHPYAGSLLTVQVLDYSI